MTISRSLTRRSDARLRYALIGLGLFVAVGAVYGAVMLITDGWHLPVQDLQPLPLESWVLPGLALFALVTSGCRLAVGPAGDASDLRRY
jgi:hypothetical protein